MIVPMKHLSLVCLHEDRNETLDALRNLGCVHVKFGDNVSDERRRAQAAYEASQLALKTISDPSSAGVARGAKNADVASGDFLDKPLAEFDSSNPVQSILALSEERARANSAVSKFSEMLDVYSKFGNLDLDCVAALESKGLHVHLLRLPSSLLPRMAEFVSGVKNADADAIILNCANDGKNAFVGIVTSVDGTVADAGQFGIEVLPNPGYGVAQMRALLAGSVERIDQVGAELEKAAAFRDEIVKISNELKNASEFERVADSLESDGELSWITGWIPAEKSAELQIAAEANAWGLLLRDPADDELPPVMIRPPRLFKPVAALFKGLGIAPAYRETDISVPFFCFFSLFFAMLVGDGAYGMIILACTLALRKKLRQLPVKGWFALLTSFSLATIGWGVLSNTWFGCSPACLNNPIAEWLADPSYGNMMLLCFTLGLAHLGIARIWNFICLFPDSLAYAELGWTGTLVAMYCIICNIVGVFPTLPPWVVPLLAVSAVLLFLFSVKPKDLKKEGITLGMLPLNIVGTLGDIISYVRLFAVGLASVKVAQNFNDMALQLALPLWLKIVPMILIMLIGHGLNLLMAGLSVLVHAVRLNTLEFSNHKGISWSGSEFRPFGKMP